MQILVTGGTGFVGSHTAEAFVAAGHRVRLLARTPAKVAQVFDGRSLPYDDPAHVEIVQGDMTDAVSVTQALDGCDAVLHAAAEVGVASSGPSALEGNVVGTSTVLGAAIEAGIDPILYTSTVAVFYPPRQSELDVTSPLAEPISAYGRSKRDCELAVRALQDAGAPITTFYIGGVYGPHQPTLDSALKGIVAAAGQMMVVTPGGVGVLDVRDLAQLFLAALEPEQGPRRFMAAGRFHTWREWTDLLSDVIGRPCKEATMPKAAMTALGRAIDAAKKVRPFDYPLTYEAALYMTSGVGGNDGPTLDALGVRYRPAVDTLADTTRWLIAAGHLPADAAPALAP